MHKCDWESCQRDIIEKTLLVDGNENRFELTDSFIHRGKLAIFSQIQMIFFYYDTSEVRTNNNSFLCGGRTAINVNEPV